MHLIAALRTICLRFPKWGQVRVKVFVVGIDCATEAGKVGLAPAAFDDGHVVLGEVCFCRKGRTVADEVASMILGQDCPVLLSIDAPLGWPTEMRTALLNHQAGAWLTVSADHMFRRETDRFIHERVGKRPLDVGADRIARTAHAALSLLHDIGQCIGTQIDLAWQRDLDGVSAIEVYPAATLTARGFRADGYKKTAQRAERREILRSLESEMDVTGNRVLLEGNADALDAVVCVLAARDFLEGKAIPPDDPATAAREGWIWTRPPLDSMKPVLALRRSQASQRSAHREKLLDLELDGVITELKGMRATDVYRKRVLCPCCRAQVFQMWPFGWDAHAARCAGLLSSPEADRKAEFKTKFNQLFR